MILREVLDDVTDDVWTYISRSMADQDSDRWIFEVLAPELRRKMKNLKDEVQWTDLVYVDQIFITFSVHIFFRAQSLREAHAKGITREEIEGALKIMPFVRAFHTHVTSMRF